MPDPGAGNGWSEYQRLVLSEIQDLKDEVKGLHREISELRTGKMASMEVEIALLKVKSGIWGAAAGMIPAALLVAWFLLGHASL